jgi:hypothetical protein
MSPRLLQLPLALLLAFGVAAAAPAQALDKSAGDPAKQTVLPVWNNASGKLEALLVLEPVDGAKAGTRWHFGNNSLDTTFGLEAGDSLALLCNRKSGVGGALANLSNNCMLATLGQWPGRLRQPPGQRERRAQPQRRKTRFFDRQRP